MALQAFFYKKHRFTGQGIARSHIFFANDPHFLLYNPHLSAFFTLHRDFLFLISIFYHLIVTFFPYTPVL